MPPSLNLKPLVTKQEVFSYYIIQTKIHKAMGILKICAKCADRCSIKFEDDNGNVKAENDSYVPENINIGGEDDDGDYIDIEIDTKTGRILNWKPLKDADVIREIKKA